MGRRAAGIFAELDSHRERIPLPALRNWFEQSDVGFDDICSFMRFHPDRYVRNLMHGGPAYQALVLCWRNGQRSPIHDHCGSSCAVKVLQGVATETVFAIAPNGMIYATGSSRLETGMITASQDSDIHQMSNLEGGHADLVTLHVYSPALLTMNMYSLVERSVTRFFDPVNDEFYEGAGI